MHVDRVVELRVHGVSGTPPEELLDRRLVTRVAGDGITGFYRPTLEAESTDSVPAGSSTPSIAGPVLEGYAWGGFTSGAPARAFWLLLLPFSLINVAPRLRPGDPVDPAAPAARRRLRTIWFLARVLALVLTIVLTLAFVGIGIDLVGWQCGGNRCQNATPAWLMNRIMDKSSPHRIAIGALLPLLALAALWFVSWTSMRKTEQTAVILDPSATDEDDPADAIEVGLRSRWMWDNEAPVRRLRAIHLQAGVATSLAFTTAAMQQAWAWLGGAIALAVVGYAVAMLGVPSFVGHRAIPRWHRVSVALWLLLGAEALVVFARLLFVSDAIDPNLFSCRIDVGTRSCHPAGTLPGYGGTLLWLFIGELGIVGILLFAVRAGARAAATPASFGEPGPKPGLAARGTSVLTLMAVFLASVFTSGAYLFGASWLDSGSIAPAPSDVAAAARKFAVPEVLQDAGLAYFLAVVMAVVVLVAFGVWMWWRVRAVSPDSPLIVPGSFVRDYGTADPASGRGRQILTAMWLGRVVDRAGWIVGLLMWLGAVLTAVFGFVLVLEHVGVDWAQKAARRLTGVHTDRELFGAAPETLQGFGAYLAVWTLLLLVVLGGLAFRVPATRRSVGILWDLASFWPRLAHPLAPPCYAERTVPDLALRINWHVGQGRGVVLAAHSQGTVISAATVLQLSTQDARTEVPLRVTMPEVGLLTFGCVLRRLYGRYFPAYFGPQALAEVRDALATPSGGQRWRNLWRYTDYLGGPVMSGPPPRVESPWTVCHGGDPAAAQPGPVRIDAHLRDPEFGRAPGDTVFPPPGRHSSFWRVAEFQQAVVFVAGLV
jgi:hypothetical protein